MFKQGYYVTAELQVKTGKKAADARIALKQLCEQTEAKEPGCSLFRAHYFPDQENKFLLWERFENKAAFDQHFIEQHTLDYLALGLTEVVQFFQTDIV